jgi:hypothetical protein
MPDIELIDVPSIHWPAACEAISDTPPSSMSSGLTYVVGTSPTGVWASFANAVAWFGPDAQWHYQSPFIGRRIYVTALGAYRQWNGTAWAADAVGGGGDGRLWETDFIWPPAHQQQGTSFSTTGNTAYFVYLGRTKSALSPTRVRYFVQTATVATYIEVGLFSSPSSPNRTAQVLTCLAADVASTNTISNGDKQNASPFSLTIAAETYVWYGFRTFTPVDSGGTSSGVIRGIIGDYGRGSILLAAGISNAVAAFTVGNTYSGTPSTETPQFAAAPYCYITF